MQKAVAQLRSTGFARLEATQWQGLLGLASEGYRPYADSWDRLDPDRWMGDGGTYRKRRFATFGLDGDTIARKPHQPHYQSRIHNQLNGGVDRWFSPVEPEIADHPITHGILGLGAAFARRISETAEINWHGEMHQFRIEAKPFERATPTPEGLHQDGVTLVIMMLIARQNLVGGLTGIRDLEGRLLAEVELASPFEMVVLDDRRVQHVVSPIKPVKGPDSAIRDALVLTFREESCIDRRPTTRR
ncbi:hypothetical protein CAF53_01720 [Sphingobium sp. LB126]|nr:hypothetical protein CAF53_01720 [Sphingobium sp. LB126]